MNNLLKEELEKFRTLSIYNPKMTLTENISELGEAFGLSPATTARDVETALGKNLENFMRELKLSTKSVSEVTALLEKDVKSFEKEFTKAIETDIKNGYPKGSMGPAAKEMSKIDVMRRIAAESAGKKLSPNEIKSLIDEVAAANKLKVSQYVPKTPRVRVPNPTSEEVKIINDTTKKYPTIRNWPWGKLLKWGLGIGLSTTVLYGIYKLTHDDEPPLQPGTVPPTPLQPGTVPPTPGSTTPTINRYKVCTGTYTQGCKTDPTGAIGQVQKCLGIVVDGKFWNKTQRALEARGFSGGFTDADITKICGNSGTPQPNPTTPNPTTPNPQPAPQPSPEDMIDNSKDILTNDNGL